MKGYVYILQSLKNNRYYVGSTQNIEIRFAQHDNGRVKSTKYLRPLKIVYCEEFDEIAFARKLEYLIKKTKSKRVIEKIISSCSIIKVLGL